MGRYGYDRVGREPSGKRQHAVPKSELGISSMGSVSGGCDTLVLETAPEKRAPKREATVRTQSKMGVLTAVLAVLFSQYVICVALAILIVLHHNRSIDWFPALIEVTGKGYPKSIDEIE
ncbi:unnamed protein product [Cylicocyclus nassatus]|uniref:Uncharacterized protein n=1 Tax=Cylicocyclus nassatus TaxID=53992 RepID=A0AA36H3X5_CYLNA|nr:unnamed protein product [Cylicocyclus nassatus]